MSNKSKFTYKKKSQIIYLTATIKKLLIVNKLANTLAWNFNNLFKIKHNK